MVNIYSNVPSLQPKFLVYSISSDDINCKEIVSGKQAFLPKLDFFEVYCM